MQAYDGTVVPNFMAVKKQIHKTCTPLWADPSGNEILIHRKQTLNKLGIKDDMFKMRRPYSGGKNILQRLRYSSTAHTGLQFHRR